MGNLFSKKLLSGHQIPSQAAKSEFSGKIESNGMEKRQLEMHARAKCITKVPDEALETCRRR